MRAWGFVCLLAATAAAQEEDRVAGKAEDPVALLVKQMEAPEASARARAARALGRTKDERAVAAARAALADADETVRVTAAVALVRLAAADATVINVLCFALRSPDWYTRWDACVALGALGPDALGAAPVLLAAAADPKLDLGREASIALCRVAPREPHVLAGLVLLLESDVDLDRPSLLRALDAAGHIALARDWLAKELVANRYGIRPRVATLLGKCGIEGASRLKDALESEDPAVRAGAIYELDRETKIGSAIFVAQLSDPTHQIRSAAIFALERRKAVDAAPRIAGLLSDPEPYLRLRAARALRELRTPVPEAGPGLVRLAAEGDQETSLAAIWAMRVTGFAALAAFLECGFEAEQGPELVTWSVRLRPRAGSDPLDRTLDLLIAALEDEKHGAALVQALRETLAKDEDAILLAALAADDAPLRRAAAVLLGHLAQDPAICTRALEKARKDKDPDVRAAAEAALVRIR